MAPTNHIEPFDPKVGNWESYLYCFECYLIANGIEGDDVRCTTLLSTCSQEVFDIARNLVAPSKLLVMLLDEIQTKLKEYFKPKTDDSIRQVLLLKPELMYKTTLKEALRIEAAKISLCELKLNTQSHTSWHTDAVHYSSTADSSDDQSESSDDGVYRMGANQKLCRLPHHSQKSP
ncbi:UNVERIFIED_CONTAM: hypothetical protein K2H54_051828 [Gekko kuhli]